MSTFALLHTLGIRRLELTQIDPYLSFHGEVLPADILMDHDRWPEIDVWGFIARNSKEYRGAEMMEFAKSIRAKHKRVGAVGYCIGAWGAFQMGSKDRKLVDCVMIAHPTSLDKKEIDDIDVPVQILAPQHDPVFTEELKSYCNETIPKLGLAYDYQFFPKATHGFANRGDTSDKVEVKALERGKNATVSWFKQWLLE